MEAPNHTPHHTNFFDAILEIIDYTVAARQDTDVSKDDVLDSITARISLLIPKLLMRTTVSASTVHGWHMTALAPPLQQ